jgi:putative DNA primase/helicase
MVQEMYGYCLMEGNPRHKIFYLFGDTARNGKSTVAQIICGIIGWKNCSVLSLEQLTGENSHILTALVGKQINFSDETSSKYIESSKLTSIVAEGNIDINPKNKPNFSYKVRSKFIVSCNYIPRFKDEQGMKNRAILIPFNYKLLEKDRIDDFDKILLEKEGAGILNWGIEGLKYLKQNRLFTISEESQEEIYENNIMSNTTLGYLETNYVFKDELEKPFSSRELYGDVGDRDSNPTGYRLYAKLNGIIPVSFSVFAKELKKFSKEFNKIKEIRKGSNGDRFYVGLENRNVYELEHDTEVKNRKLLDEF